MLFHSECFVTQWARNIFFNVDIPVMLSECFLGLELFATHITNKITNHYCEFWFLQLLWSYSDECLSQTDSKAVSWNFHFSDDRSNTLNARPLIEISGWVFSSGSQRFEREENCSKYGYQNRAHPAHLLCHFLRRVCGSVWWLQLLFCCGSSGGFMLCFASVMDHIWCTEPIYKSCTTSYDSHFTCITYHGKLMSATNLHTLTLHRGLMTILVFLHRKYIPTSTNFSKLFLNSFSEKVLALNFFSSPLYHPPSLPAVYSLPLYSHCQCHSLLRNLFYICIKFNNKSMILARCTGGVIWWFHCRACIH